MSNGATNERVSVIVDEMRSTRADMSGLRQDIQAVQPRIASLEATLEQANDRTRSEIQVLFDKHADHEERIASVEKSYWPRAAQERFEDKLSAAMSENKRDREKMEKESRASLERVSEQVRAVSVKVAWIAGGISAVSALIQLGLSYLKGAA